MKLEIKSREDIKFIITHFYDKLLNDELMRPFFQEFLLEDTLEEHLEVITSFWEDILFDTTKYHQNVLKKHMDKNRFIKFKKEHFNLWLSYFNETIDANFLGLNAELMKNRAISISTVMQLKMDVF